MNEAKPILKLPLLADTFGNIYDAENQIIAECNYVPVEDDPRFAEQGLSADDPTHEFMLDVRAAAALVHAANMHGELVAALRGAMTTVYARESCPFGVTYGGNPAISNACHCNYHDAYRDARDLIARAAQATGNGGAK